MKNQHHCYSKKHHKRSRCSFLFILSALFITTLIISFILTTIHTNNKDENYIPKTILYYSSQFTPIPFFIPILDFFQQTTLIPSYPQWFQQQQTQQHDSLCFSHRVLSNIDSLIDTINTDYLSPPIQSTPIDSNNNSSNNNITHQLKPTTTQHNSTVTIYLPQTPQSFLQWVCVVFFPQGFDGICDPVQLEPIQQTVTLNSTTYTSVPHSIHDISDSTHDSSPTATINQQQSNQQHSSPSINKQPIYPNIIITGNYEIDQFIQHLRYVINQSCWKIVVYLLQCTQQLIASIRSTLLNFHYCFRPYSLYQSIILYLQHIQQLYISYANSISIMNIIFPSYWQYMIISYIQPFLILFCINSGPYYDFTIGFTIGIIITFMLLARRRFFKHSLHRRHHFKSTQQQDNIHYDSSLDHDWLKTTTTTSTTTTSSPHVKNSNDIHVQQVNINTTSNVFIIDTEHPYHQNNIDGDNNKSIEQNENVSTQQPLQSNEVINSTSTTTHNQQGIDQFNNVTNDNIQLQQSQLPQQLQPLPIIPESTHQSSQPLSSQSQQQLPQQDNNQSLSNNKFDNINDILTLFSPQWSTDDQIPDDDIAYTTRLAASRKSIALSSAKKATPVRKMTSSQSHHYNSTPIHNDQHHVHTYNLDE